MPVSVSIIARVAGFYLRMRLCLDVEFFFVLFLFVFRNEMILISFFMHINALLAGNAFQTVCIYSAHSSTSHRTSSNQLINIEQICISKYNDNNKVDNERDKRDREDARLTRKREIQIKCR